MFFVGILTVAGYSTFVSTFFTSLDFVQLIEAIQCKDFETFLLMIMLLIDGTSLVLAFIFQSYFLYILIRRFPHFLNIWSDRDFSTEVDVPRLPTGDLRYFFVNNAIIVFLLAYPLLFALLYLSLYAPAPVPSPMTFCCIAILILPLFFEIHLLYFTIKNRKQRDRDPKNLYKDNKRIPFATGIQSIFFFCAISHYRLHNYLLFKSDI